MAQVNVGGQQKPAVRIQLDPAKVASLGLSLEAADRAGQRHRRLPNRTHRLGTRTFTLYANDQELAAEPGTTSSSPINTVPPCGFATSAGR